MRGDPGDLCSRCGDRLRRHGTGPGDSLSFSRGRQGESRAGWPFPASAVELLALTAAWGRSARLSGAGRLPAARRRDFHGDGAFGAQASRCPFLTSSNHAPTAPCAGPGRARASRRASTVLGAPSGNRRGLAGAAGEDGLDAGLDGWAALLGAACAAGSADALVAAGQAAGGDLIRGTGVHPRPSPARWLDRRKTGERNPWA